MRKKSYITTTDQFCGAGGSSQGVRRVANKRGGGIEVKLAMNHWPLAIETHNSNFPETDHDCADISASDPRRYQSTDVLITSPECTNHSLAKGKKRKYERTGNLWGDITIDPSAERSRATMWDVCRFAEIHQYNIIIAENVVDARNWVMWEPWLHAMHNLGYLHKCVYLNSMHCHPTPQSRDRMYVVFWRKGNPAPNLEITPKAHCPKCDSEVLSKQTWKNPRKKFGKYRQQYVYACPQCGTVVEPYYYSAMNIIDWSIPGLPIYDRPGKPISDKTIARIQWGLERFGNKGFFVYLEHSSAANNATDIFNAMKTQTTTDATGFAMPFIVKNYQTSKCGSINDPIGTLKTISNMGIVSTQQANAWFTYYYGTKQGSSVLMDPVGTLPTNDRVALAVHPMKEQLTIDDILYRTIRPHEVKKGMAFDDDYIICGNGSQQVKQLGNAVTPPAMELLFERCIETLM